MNPGRGSAASRPVFACVFVLALAVTGLGEGMWAEPARADRIQDDGDPFEDAPTDSTEAAEPVNRLTAATQLAAQQPAVTDTTVTASSGFLLNTTYSTKAGTKADVQQRKYYAELSAALLMSRAATFNTTTDWSWSEYRKQNKTVENRKNTSSYNLGTLTPLVITLDGRWDWNENKTTNTAGFANLFKLDKKTFSLSASKTKFDAGGLKNTLRIGASAIDQASVNINQRNDLQESTVGGGLQSGWEVADGIVLAGRFHGTATAGDRLLAGFSSSSSAQGDSVGVGVYYDRALARGRVSLSRSNFEKKYLEFRRNANGLVDTVGVDEVDKVVNELETKDALTLNFENKMRVGRVGLETKASRTTDDLDYAASGVGLKERLHDDLKLKVTFAAGADSFAVDYGFGWKWDDQRIKGATANRGRQYTKDRDYKINWYRTVFRATDLTFQYHQGLVQNIAQFEHNLNDKDRLTSDISMQADRNWPDRLRAKMVFSYRRVEDLSIRESRSSNNNIKDSYEMTPSYSWTVSDRVSLSQNYRLYIQYTNYVYSDLETVSREDNYSKRGNLTTKVTVKPTDRVTVNVRHDYNKRFNATKAIDDAAGNTFYQRDQNQTISTVDLDLRFSVAKGVSLEMATYSTRDDRTSLGTRISESRTDSGEMMVGARVNRTWGRVRPLELSAVVKKYNAFGPSITPTSADYWEADVWLKWEF